MKNHFLLSLLIALIVYGHVLAQVPSAIPYQAVARNSSGVLIASQNISLRISIHNATATGTVVYKETHAATTNTLGLFTVNIGQGIPVTGTFNGISWGSAAKFLQVEMDAAGGSNYVSMGTQQMMSVAYALYSLSSNLPNGTASGNTLRWNGTAWVASTTLTDDGTNIGIGTSPLLYKLQVNGDAQINTVRVGKGNGIPNYSTVVGLSALNNNTTGDINTAIGYEALKSNTTGTDNTATGAYSLRNNTIGTYNCAVGLLSLGSNISGNTNTAIGTSALGLNVDGDGNSSIGINSLHSNSSGNTNSAVGVETLYNNSTGYNNSALGSYALGTNTTGNNNTAIGTFANVSTGTLTNATAIGANALVSISNAVVLGNNANVGIGTDAPSQKLHVIGNGLFTGTVTASCGVLSCSDRRYKQHIKPLLNSLDKVCRLDGVTYTWRKDEFPDMHFTDALQIGIIAQDLEKEYPELVATDKYDYKTVDYAKITPILIEAIKELNVKLENAILENKQLKKQVEKINAHIGMEIRAEK
jgi:hypothetical protein